MDQRIAEVAARTGGELSQSETRSRKEWCLKVGKERFEEVMVGLGLFASTCKEKGSVVSNGGLFTWEVKRVSRGTKLASGKSHKELFFEKVAAMIQRVHPDKTCAYPSNEKNRTAKNMILLEKELGGGMQKTVSHSYRCRTAIPTCRTKGTLEAMAFTEVHDLHAIRFAVASAKASSGLVALADCMGGLFSEERNARRRFVMNQVPDFTLLANADPSPGQDPAAMAQDRQTILGQHSALRAGLVLLFEMIEAAERSGPEHPEFEHFPEIDDLMENADRVAAAAARLFKHRFGRSWKEYAAATGKNHKEEDVLMRTMRARSGRTPPELEQCPVRARVVSFSNSSLVCILFRVGMAHTCGVQDKPQVPVRLPVWLPIDNGDNGDDNGDNGDNGTKRGPNTARDILLLVRNLERQSKRLRTAVKEAARSGHIRVLAEHLQPLDGHCRGVRALAELIEASTPGQLGSQPNSERLSGTSGKRPREQHQLQVPPPPQPPFQPMQQPLPSPPQQQQQQQPQQQQPQQGAPLQQQLLLPLPQLHPPQQQQLQQQQQQQQQQPLWEATAARGLSSK